MEGQIVRFSDRIAYINHDIDDAIRSGVISEKDLPEKNIRVLDRTHSNRINNLIDNLVHASADRDCIQLSPSFQEALDELREFMFRNVYDSVRVKRAEDMNKVEMVIRQLYDYFCSNPERMPDLYREIAGEDGKEEAVKDYISGMTDRYAISLYSDLFVPKAWTDYKG